MNALSTIAAAVKTALAAASPLGGVAFTVERVFALPDYNTAATRELKVYVLAFTEDLDLHGENSTRASCDHLFDVHIAIVKRVSAVDVASEAALTELDGLSDFRQQVIDFLKGNRRMDDAQLDALKNDPAAYDVGTLKEKKAFVSVIKGTYRLQR